MKAIECHLPQEFDKSFIVFKEKGKYFPCPWHYHSEYEIVLVTKSTGIRLVGDHVGYFNEGDLVFIGSLLPHLWINDPEYTQGNGEKEAEAIVIHFLENFLGDNFFNLPEMKVLKNFLKLSQQAMVITGETREKISDIMKRMLTMTGIQRLASLFDVFDILCNSNEYEFLASPAFLQQKEVDTSSRFEKINAYIMKNFDQVITLKEISAVANMAVSTFCNFFKEHYRVTFVEYLNVIRIGHACKLLTDLDYTIVDIAYKCGFNNIANFNRQFRKLKNMTPSEYRRTLNLSIAV